jgi:hypothetical protein
MPSFTARERVIECGVRARMVAWMNVDVHLAFLEW